MSDREGLWRRAIQQSQTGNYWAGKCVGLLEELVKLSEVAGPMHLDGEALIYEHPDGEVCGVDVPCPVVREALVKLGVREVGG